MAARWSKNWFAIGLGALLLAVGVAKYRHGFFRTDGIDAAIPYAGGRALVAGTDPYDRANIRRVYLSAPGSDPKIGSDWLPIYPPVTLVLVAPFSGLAWDRYLDLWMAGAGIMVALTFWGIVTLADLRWNEPRTGLLLLFYIDFAPLRCAFELGQNALPAIGLGVLCLAALRFHRNILAGLLLAVACCLKPHVVFLLPFYLLLLRRWKALGWTAGGIAFVSMAAILWAPLRRAGYFPACLYWLLHASQTGANVEATAQTAARFQMLNLKIGLSTLLHDALMLDTVNWIICLALGAVATTAIIRRHKRSAEPDLLAASIVGVYTLLPFYHRFPDAFVLVLPMAWAVSRLGTGHERVARIVLLLMLPFLSQVPDFLDRLADPASRAAHHASAWWFQCFVLAILVWMLVLICLALIYSAMRMPLARET